MNCKGLHYLHHEAPESIIHGDLKSSNGMCILETIENISYNFKPRWKTVISWDVLSIHFSSSLHLIPPVVLTAEWTAKVHISVN